MIPGLGLSGVLLYWGVEDAVAARTLIAVLPALVVALGLALALRSAEQDGGLRLASAAALLLLGLLVSAGTPPHAVVAPTTLLLLSAFARG